MTAWLPRDAAAAAPLAGVRVLDFSELLPGPFMTQALVELGADVLKVERPPHGDNVRRMSPAVFEAVNRGKRSVTLNLKQEAGRAQALALAREADVLVEAYRPGVMARLGLGWDELSALNARLVVVSLSGYGAHGPRAQQPGHDINYLAAAGLVSLAVTEAQPSPPMAVPFADLGGAVYALAALQAALLQRARTGRGQHLDVSLADCMLHWMNPRLAVLRQAGAEGLAAQRALVQQRPAYGVFACADGRAITLAALEDAFWRGLVDALDLAPYAGPQWQSYAQRAPHAAAINRAVQAALARWPSGEALRRLEAADVPAAAVAEPDELPHDAHFAARGCFGATDRSGPLCRFPVRLAGMPPAPRRAPDFNALETS